MGRMIIEGFKTEEKAEIYRRGMESGRKLHKDIEVFIIDDRDYNGEWTVNID